MNGEVKSYRLNDPMTWQEFKALPDDIKVIYIKGIRERFRVSDSKIFEMFGVKGCTGNQYFATRGLCLGRAHRFTDFDKEGWIKWVNGVPLAESEKEQEQEVVVCDVEESKANCPNKASTLNPTQAKAIPRHGSMTFDCNPYDALKRIEDAFKAMGMEGKVFLTVYWDILDGDSDG